MVSSIESQSKLRVALVLAGCLSCALLLLTQCTSEQDSSGSWYQFENNVLTVQKDQGAYIITALSKDIFKVDYSQDGTPGEMYAAILDEPVKVTFEAKRNKLTFSTMRVKVDVLKNPVRLVFRDRETGAEIEEASGYVVEGDSTKLSFKLKENEAIWGTGARSIPLDRRGYRFQCYNQANYGYEMDAEFLNYSIPHIVSSREYMILIDNPARAYFDIGKSDPDILEFGSRGGNTVYYFINGDGYYDLAKSYADLTGRQPLPPLWAFGNLQSRFGYKNQQEAEQLVRSMQNAGYPLDAIILDLYWFSKEPRDGRMGNLAWDKNRWPDPSGMMSAFKQSGVRTITVSEPFFTKQSKHFTALSEQRLLGVDDTGETMTMPDFFFGDAGLIDIFKPEAKAWLWAQYQEQKELGVSGWWCDLGEPELHPDSMMHVVGRAEQVHGLYGHEWTRLFYENYLEDYRDERPFVLARAGYAGSQRYGLIPWSGDVSRSWSGLQAQLPIMLSMGLSGLGYMHSDAGGFAGGQRDPELYTRWMQFAVFTPVFRPHADPEVAPPEPIFWEREVQENVKPFIELRYRMLPYNYTMAWKNNQTGLPLARPLFYDWSWDSKLDSIEQVYMWGPDMLIAPVLHPGDTSIPVYLPRGDWVDFWTHDYYEGRQALSVPVTMAQIPVFVETGSIIPTVDLIMSTDDYSTKALNLTYYCDKGRTRKRSEVYMDDGHTRDAYARGQYHLLQIDALQKSEELTFELRLLGRGYEGAPPSRALHFELIGFPQEPKELMVDSTVITYSWDTTSRVLAFDLTLNDQSDIILTYQEENDQ